MQSQTIEHEVPLAILLQKLFLLTIALIHTAGSFLEEAARYAVVTNHS